MREALERAWQWREKKGLFAPSPVALRIFHGPGEGVGELRSFAIDRFGDHYWITYWEKEKAGSTPLILGAPALEAILKFLQTHGAISVVGLLRPEKGVPEEPKTFWGNPPEGRFTVMEPGLKFSVQMLGARHPGLFLDHAPLRQWLRGHARGWRVLNTFAYTGSLSVAAGAGGATHVTTLDLGKPVTQWAQANWELNELSLERSRFIAGDVFEWLPRLKREGARFDCVILDPPSFSRGKKGNFSTSKDLEKLHGLALDVLEKGGVLATSINSAQISREKYEAEVVSAAEKRGREFEVLVEIEQPETFPARTEPERYLKGWVLKEV